jgi:hypothetical protein
MERRHHLVESGPIRAMSLSRADSFFSHHFVKSEERMEQFKVEVDGEACNACGLKIYGSAFSIPRLPGIFCGRTNPDGTGGLACVETALFGTYACRWCGAATDKPYTYVGSRLCSEDCGESYHAHVLGDKSAALGTGRRLALWMTQRRKKSAPNFVRPSVPAIAVEAVA